MARQIIDLPKMTKEELEAKDLVIVRDVSSRTDKKCSVEDLLNLVSQEIESIQNARKEEYPIGVVQTFYDDKDHSDFLGFTWKEITDFELVAYADYSGSTVVGKNIAAVRKTGNSYLVEFEKEMADTKYVAFISAEVSGVAQEIVGVFNKNKTSFVFDVYNYVGQASLNAKVNIAVFGRLKKPEYRKWRRTA